MTTIDNPGFLANGGYLQKGREKNVRPADLGKRVHDLAPSRCALFPLPGRRLSPSLTWLPRWYRDEKIFQLERRGLFSTVCRRTASIWFGVKAQS